MSLGDLTLFDDFYLQLGKKAINLDSDEYRIALYTSARAPVIGEAAPIYAVTNEVSGGTEYVAGGKICSSTMSYALVAGAGDWKVTADPAVSWAQDASGPINIRWGLLYNNTASPKVAAGFIVIGDGADVSLQAGPVDFTFNATALTRIRAAD